MAYCKDYTCGTLAFKIMSIIALVYELLATLILKPIYWNPEISDVDEFWCRIYVDCEDPKDVFDKNAATNFIQLT